MSTEHVKQYKVVTLSPDDTPDITENMESIALYGDVGEQFLDTPVVGPLSDIFTPAAGFTLQGGKYYFDGPVCRVVGMEVRRTASVAVAVNDSVSIGKFAAGIDPPTSLAGLVAASGYFQKADNSVFAGAAASFDTNAGTGMTVVAQGVVAAAAATQIHFPQLSLAVGSKFVA